MTRFWLLFLLLAPADAALNLGAFATDDLVKHLRSAIFVETQFLEERMPTRCSSLDGPRCLETLQGKSVLDGPGVIPERLLHDLGDGPGDFATPEYFALDSFLRQGQSLQQLQQAPQLLQGQEAEDFLASGRSSTTTGLLHFSGAGLDRRLPVTFSHGLPQDLVATWDGRWIARSCDFASSSAALPAPDSELAISAENFGLVGKGPSVGHKLSASVELAGALGYLRFSRPVAVRSLFVRWEATSDQPSALVGARLGLQTVWKSHLDVHRFESGWVDVVGDRMAVIDELVFVAAKGLQIGAVAIASTADEEERSVMMLRPVPSEDGPLRFALSLQRLSSEAAPFVASLQEVIDNKLRLRETAPARAVGAPRGERAPGLLPMGSQDTGEEGESQMKLAATHNALLFEHQFLPELATNAMHALQGLSRVAKGVLPEDLRRQLAVEESLPENVLAFAREGWALGTPTTLPSADGMDDAVQKYITAKKQQMQFDLVTAAVFYLTQKEGAQEP